MIHAAALPITHRARTIASMLSGAILIACGPIDAPVAPERTTINATTADARAGSCPSLPGGITALRLNPVAIVAKPGVSGDVTVLDQRGKVLPGCAFAWSSSDPAVATVSAGRVTVANTTSGQTTIVAKLSGKVTLSASATLSIAADPVVDTILVTPGPMILMTGGTSVQFAATARDATGKTIWGHTTQWAKAYPSTNMNVSSSGLVTTTVGEGGTNYVQVTIRNKFNQVKVAINPGSLQVLCWDNVWLGWAVYGDCTLKPQTAGSSIVMRFRVVDGLNQDIPNAGMTFSVSTNTGTVSPASLAAPTVGTEYRTTWTLGTTAGENVLQALSYFGGVGVHIIGQ